MPTIPASRYMKFYRSLMHVRSGLLLGHTVDVVSFLTDTTPTVVVRIQYKNHGTVPRTLTLATLLCAISSWNHHRDASRAKHTPVSSIVSFHPSTMSRVEPSQTGQTAPQRCPVNLSWNLHKTLKESIPVRSLPRRTSYQTDYNLPRRLGCGTTDGL